MMSYNYPKLRPFLSALLLLSLAAPNVVRAQVTMAATGSYSQNFDTPTLGNTGTPAWTDNSTLPSWFWQASGAAPTTYLVGTGSTNTGGRYSYGSNLATDRAMGSLGGGTQNHDAQGVLLQNTSGAAITNITVSYTGEQWRNGGNTAVQSLSFYYQVSGSAITALTPGTNGTWTNVSALNFNSLQNTATAAALDGNLGANRTTFTNIAIPALVVPAGSYIMLKWDDLNDTGNDHGMGVDDVTINWTVSAPVLTSSTITFGSTTTTTAVVNLNGGTGANRILIARQGSAVSFAPSNGSSYTGASAAFGAGTALAPGEFLVYQGAGTGAGVVTVTGLTPSTTYHFATYDYDGVPTYSTPAGVASVTTPGPILYSTGTYTQDFDGLPASGTFTPGAIGPFYAGSTPVNATGMQGWQYANSTGSNVNFAVSDGTSSTGSVFSYGTGTATDRALGAVASGSVIARLGAVIRNTSASPLTNFTINFTGEQWRNGGSNIPNALAFEYSLNGTDISTGTYVPVTSLNFNSPVSSAVPVALDGNVAANQTAVGFTVDMGANWLPGTDLVIRWSDSNDSGADDGLAIDGFSFSASGPVAPATQDHDISFANTTTVGSDINWVNGDGAKRMVVLNTTNSFTNPANGAEYTGNAVYGGGEQVVYVGTGSTVSVSNLSPSTTYHARVFAYNGLTASAIYNTSTATLNPNSFTTATPVAPTQLVITSINGGVDPIQYSAPFFLNTFSVTVQSQDGSNSPQDVAANTNVSLSLNFGAGSLGGTLTGTILAGTHEVIITGVTYDAAETGVTIDAARTSGDLLSTGTSAGFTVLGVPTDLVFTNVPVTGLVGSPVSTFQVEARRADSSVDGNYTGSITLSVLSGPGNIGGTISANALAGVATFSNVTFDAAGAYQMEANANGIFAGASSVINITAVPTMTELVVPRYMGSKSASGTNANRTPFAVCVQFDNLVPNALYDVRAGLALTSDAANTYGAGNIWNGTTYGTTTLSGTFTADGTGSSGPYWLFIQPTANATRFSAGQVHNLRISTMLNGSPSPTNPQFVSVKTITALDIATTALTPATTDDGAYVRGVAGACLTGKFILAYDNVAGTGDPLSSFQAITTTPSDITAGNYSGHPVAIADIYKQNGTSAMGDYPAIVPIGANNPSGVRRIEARNVDNTLYNAITDADGVWPGGADFTTITRRSVGTIGVSDPQLAFDGDSDGTADCLDGCPVDPNKIAPGACGCGVADVPATYYSDLDNDGLGDANDPIAGFTCTVPAGYVTNNTDPCPALQNGTPGDACDDGNANTVLDVIGAGPGCACAGTTCTTNLNLIFTTDGVTNIGWELRQQGSNILVQSGGGVYPASAGYSVSTCLPDGDFYLVVTSDLGGIVQGGVQGGYVLQTSSGARLVDNRNNFLTGLTSQVANGEGFSLPMGTDRVIYTSCDKLDWRANEYIVANDNATVAAQYGVNNANSGYEMWFYNPNGGYSFRRFHSHAVSDGFAPNNAQRACHIKINNWSVANHIADGVLLNVKVRGRVNGTNLPWGAACRFMRNEQRAQCPLTKLLDLPGNPYYSCGSSRNMGPGNLVHARPVTRLNNGNVQSANKYQFRFRIPAENITVIKTSNTGQYWVPVTQPLQACKTYEVDVRASFDNGATWCTDFIAPALTDPWGDVCLFSTNGCETFTAGQRMAVEGMGAAHLYPNPNRGDQVVLNVSEVAQGVTTVSVDLYDAFGKRVMARTMAVNDGFVNAVIDLNGELAAGMYTVSITAGATVHTERLVIQP